MKTGETYKVVIFSQESKPVVRITVIRGDRNIQTVYSIIPYQERVQKRFFFTGKELTNGDGKKRYDNNGRSEWEEATDDELTHLNGIIKLF
ncbi:MAG: hypothetical protein HYW23_03335 [Candidatus Aenigmarchaeota archaeon]|nr:hypothetical protein [Candidatus Aenigmarchaeota archaeon]